MREDNGVALWPGEDQRQGAQHVPAVASSQALRTDAYVRSSCSNLAILQRETKRKGHQGLQGRLDEWE